MKKTFLFLTITLLLSMSDCVQAIEGGRKILFDRDWVFCKGSPVGAESPDYDDSAWRKVTLPHDWSIEPLEKNDTAEVIGPFSRASVGGSATGQTVGGEGWYRKHFTLSATESPRRYELYFEGAYNQAEVWVNGVKVCYNAYGYSAFRCDITAQCHLAGQPNVVAVRVVNAGKNSRWYAGSGLYRHVWLMQTDALHLDAWSTFVRTDTVADHRAQLSVQTVVYNRRSTASHATLTVALLKGRGPAAAEQKVTVDVAAADSAPVSLMLNVSNPHLWSPDAPYLYHAVFSLFEGGQCKDQWILPIGIRTLSFSAERGFLLNGVPTLLRGGCIHHDNGLLGAASYDRAEERKVQLLKDNGYNAVRGSHNPMSEHFLSACDSLGLLVIDEAFDVWHQKKNKDDYHLYFDAWSRRDMQTLVRRDRNHPSVILWSIGNEIRERAYDAGVKIAADLRAAIRQLDTTRPITAGINSLWNKDRSARLPIDKACIHLDVAGYNYRYMKYEEDHAAHPDRIFLGSESVAKDAADYWSKVEELPYVIGDFTWTALDYLGESGIGNEVEIEPQENTHFFMDWPWYNGWCGDIDLIGAKKPQSYYRDVLWRRRDLSMAVSKPVEAGKHKVVSFWGWPGESLSWDFAGLEGQPMNVSVYTRADSVALFLNDRCVGGKRVSERFKASFEVPYEPGTLRAVAFCEGRREVSTSLTTPGEAVRLRLTADRTRLNADGRDLAYVWVELTDHKGRLVMDSSRKISFSCSGVGEVIAAGNGAPNDMESFRSQTPRLYNGRAMLIVKSSDDAGRITIRVQSDGLEGAALQIKTR